MITGRKVRCPSCGTTLALPPGCSSPFVRCSKCRHRFALPEDVPPTENDIATWLGEEKDTQEGPPESIVRELGSAPAEPTPPPQTDAPPVAQGEIRLVKFGHGGGLFEFPASRLRETQFRCALPRQCLRCSGRSHLEAHVVIYTPELGDSVSLEKEHSAGKLVLSDAEVRGLADEQLLERLPGVPNVPAPADMPMPYWTCDMCSAAGLISGQIQVNRETGQGWCRLRIRNLRAAELFMVAAGGKGAPGYRKLHARVSAMIEKPWDMLPEVVQHRIQQWFKPRGDEQFVAYVPDRDRARTEDGMAGILISDKRLIYHTKVRHHEVTPSEPLELKLAKGSGLGRLEIRAQSWQVRMKVDRAGMARLRRGLSLVKFKALQR